MRALLAVALAAGVLTAPAASEEKKVDPKPVELSGVWGVVSTAGHGKVVVAEGNKDEFGRPLWADSRFTISGDKLVTIGEPVVLPSAQANVGLYFAIYAGTEFRLKPGKAKDKGPAEIDLVVRKGVVLKGIYELNGDELKLCFVNWMYCTDEDEAKMAKAADAIARPSGFGTKNGQYVSYVLKRIKK
jgi:uncharacterized protein (TIGR03067 family)